MFLGVFIWFAYIRYNRTQAYDEAFHKGFTSLFGGKRANGMTGLEAYKKSGYYKIKVLTLNLRSLRHRFLQLIFVIGGIDGRSI